MSLIVVYVLISAGLGAAAGFILRKYLVQKTLTNVEKTVQGRFLKAEDQAKEILLDAKNKSLSLISKAEEDVKHEKIQLRKTQERLLSKEAFLDERTKKIDEKEDKLMSQVEKVKAIKQEVETFQEKQVEKLEQIAGLKKEDAKQELIKQVEDKYQAELFEVVKRLEKTGRRRLRRKPRNWWRR